MSTARYVGGELDLFAEVVHWKGYWTKRCRPYVAGDVLEVGAGIGANTPFLADTTWTSWTCLEPDPALAARLVDRLRSDERTRTHEVVVTRTTDLPPEPRFDTVMYLDVLEHIADDHAELERAARLLRPRGAVVVLAPAHQLLYTPFDAAIGHHRRYRRRDVVRLRPAGLRLSVVEYLDSVGLLAALANRLVLRQSMPTAGQLAVWDRFMVPCSRWLDPLLLRAVGKSILAVWTRT